MICKNQKVVLSLTSHRIETRHRETAGGEPKREAKILNLEFAVTH